MDETDAKQRLGRPLGGEVLKVCSGPYTDSIRGPRIPLGMLAQVSAYMRVPLAEEPEYAISVREIPIERLMLDYQTLEQARALACKCTKDLAHARESGARRATLNVAQRYVCCAQALLDRVESDRNRALDATIQAIVTGNLAIAALPGETCTDSGMEVKRRSPFPETLFCGHANGFLTYIRPGTLTPRMAGRSSAGITSRTCYFCNHTSWDRPWLRARRRWLLTRRFGCCTTFGSRDRKQAR